MSVVRLVKVVLVSGLVGRMTQACLSDFTSGGHDFQIVTVVVAVTVINPVHHSCHHAAPQAYTTISVGLAVL